MLAMASDGPADCTSTGAGSTMTAWLRPGGFSAHLSEVKIPLGLGRMHEQDTPLTHGDSMDVGARCAPSRGTYDLGLDRQRDF